MSVQRAPAKPPARRAPVLLAAALLFVPVDAVAQPASAPAAPAFEFELARGQALLEKSQYRDAAAVLISLTAAGGLTSHQRAVALELLTHAHVELGQLDETLRVADEAAAHAKAAGALEVLRQLELVRGSAWRFRGFAYRGVRHYEAALELAERAGDTKLASTALSLLSSVHQDLGDWSRVLDYAERSFRAQASPTAGTRFRYLLQRGIAYFEFDDRARAFGAFTEALDVARTAGNKRAESSALGELGLVAWEFDRDYDRALDLFDRARAIARASGVPGLEVTWLNNAGGTLRDAGRHDDALSRYHEALAIAKGLGQENTTAYLLKNIGQVLSAQGRKRDAEPYLLEALQQAEKQGIPKIRWMARMELGDVYRDRDPALADRYFAEGIQILEATRGSVLMERLSAGVLGRSLARYDVFDRYIEFLLARGDDGRAFAVAERARARVFLETLSAARAELAPQVPVAYRDAEGELLSRISTLQTRLRAPDVRAGERRALVAGITRAEDGLTALRVRLAVERPALAQVRFPRLWTADDIRSRILAPDETLAMFFLGRRGSACWVLDRNGMTVVKLPPREQVEAAVRRLLPTLQSPQARVDEGARAWLSAALGAPIASRLRDGARLVIVPHGILHYLPFEMLADASGRYLVERATVSYAPSASSLAYLRQLVRPAPRPAALLALGNPTLGMDAPTRERSQALAWVGHLKPLLHARAEIRRIATTFRPDSRVLEAHAATEEALRSADLRQVGILHFATHAVIDEEQPERSGLALSRGRGPFDGILQAREVYQLDLDATLVTLSACQTALGRQVTGEGMVGLSRAFFYAGAGAVAASLWNVSDRATADLMADFYQRLRAGTPIDAALTDAKRAFVRGEENRRHPYYWAAFIVTGHATVALAPAAGRTVAFPSDLAIVGILTACAVLGRFVFIVARPRRRLQAEVSGAHR